MSTVHLWRVDRDTKLSHLTFDYFELRTKTETQTCLVVTVLFLFSSL